MKMSLVRMFAAIALAFSTAGTAAAQWIKDSGGSGVYVGGGVGATQLKIDTGGLIGSTDESDTGWKVFVGYQINPYVGVEAGYYDLGKASFSGTLAVPIPPFPAGTAASVNLKSKAYAIAAVGSLPLGGSGFSLIGRLGISRSETDAGVRLGVAATNTLSDKATELTYGAGLRYDVTRALALRAEWERFRVGGSNTGDKSDVDLFTLNAFYRF